jgi:hypothetical protein
MDIESPAPVRQLFERTQKSHEVGWELHFLLARPALSFDRSRPKPRRSTHRAGSILSYTGSQSDRHPTLHFLRRDQFTRLDAERKDIASDPASATPSNPVRVDRKRYDNI